MHLDRTFGLLAIFLLAYLNSKVTFTECVQLSGFWKQLGTKNEGILYVTNRLKYICLSACWKYNLCAPCWSKTTIKTYNIFRTRQDGVWWSQISRQSTEEYVKSKSEKGRCVFVQVCYLLCHWPLCLVQLHVVNISWAVYTGLDSVKEIRGFGCHVLRSL